MEFRKKAEIMDEAAMTRAIKRIAHEIIERNKGTENLMLIGIQRRGVPLARRIGELIMQEENVTLPVGTLDITFYRDDLSLLAEHPQVKGTDIPANVNGTDMFPLLCQRPHSIFLLGARPGVAQRALENATRLFPHARLVGAAHGYFNSPDDERQAIAAVNACRPDILLVALGVPRQELWLAKHRDELHCGAAIAVGGLLDFVSGRIPRAPAWLRRCGLEWTYRLYQEPIRLFRRYVLGNPAFVLRVLLSRLRGA